MEDVEVGLQSSSRFYKGVRIAAFITIIYHFLYIGDVFIYLGMPLEPFLHTPMHIGVILAFLYLLLPARKGTTRKYPPWYDIVLAVLSLVPPLYYGLVIAPNFETTVALRLPEYSILGWLMIVLLLEAVRRVIGWIFVAVIGVIIVYALTASHFPSILLGLEYSFADVGAQVYKQSFGIFGSPARVSSIMIIAFLFFGQMLVIAGAGQTLVDLAKGLMGRFRGGPAKVSAIGSMFFGMISGSSVSNVMTTGVMTIPLMKNIGYKSNFAGAVEAVASNGGLIMPPIMGAVIFIMVDFTGISYTTVMLASFIPAFLYYTCVLLSVDFEAAKTGLKGLPKSEVPSLRRTAKNGWLYAIPVGVLLYLLIGPEFAPQKAALYSVVALLVVSAFKKGQRVGMKALLDGSEATIRGMLMIAAATATSGILIGVFQITGLGTSLAGGLLDVTGGNLWLLLPLAAIICYVLGMGMNHVAIYLILAILVVPSLIQAGIPSLAAHLFVVWWTITAFITPPLCPNVWAATAISGGTPMRTGLIAMRIAAATYLLPFAFALGPALLLMGTPAEIIIAVLSALIGVAAIASGLSGWLLTKEGWLERVLFIAGAILMIFPGWTTDGIGVVMIIAATLINIRAYRVARARARIEAA